MYLTQKQVAERFGVTTRVVNNWCREGKLTNLRLPNGTIRIPAEAVEEYVQRNTIVGVSR